MLFEQHAQNFSIRLKKELVSLDKPIVMGILNLTTDSFYDGGNYIAQDAACFQIEKMLNEGAKIIDIGAMSSRPFSKELSMGEELKMFEKHFPKIIARFPEACFSIDTYRSQVADYTLSLGGAMLNDISAFRKDDNLLNVVKKHQVPYCLMHMQGMPQTMQLTPSYNHLLQEIALFLTEKIVLLKQKGITDILIDVGFGFGKSVVDNYGLLKNLNYFQCMKLPLMVGISRKSMVYKPLQLNPKEALLGTSALHFEALRQGAKLLRVHDVKEAVQIIQLFESYEQA